MVSVLKNWWEVGEATLALQRRNLPLHESAAKNWDQFLLSKAVEPLDRGSRILDLGAGDGFTLKFLGALGFREVHGIDLRLSAKLWLSWLARRLRRSAGRPTFHVHRGDITHLPFPDGSFDVATSISVIEHGVDLTRLVKESARVLKPGGLLFVTTDYWETPLPPRASLEAYGLPWTVFSRSAVEGLIRLARENGFEPLGGAEVPPCEERTVHWQDTDYTFICLQFRRSA